MVRIIYLEYPGIGVIIQAEERLYIFLVQACDSNISLPVIFVGLFSRVKQSGREADHLDITTVRVQFMEA